MSYSYATTVASGSTALVSVPFPYLDKAHIHVLLNGVLVDDGTLTWITDGQLQLASIPTAGTNVKVYRSTPLDEPLVVFTLGDLDPNDLNAQELQSLYATQEAVDGQESALSLNAETTAYDALNKEILNVSPGVHPSSAATVSQLQPFADNASDSADDAAASAIAAAGSASAAAGSASSAAASATAAQVAKVNWLGAWVTATAYNAKDAVQDGGSSYVCKTAHTSGSTSEPGVGASWSTYWDLMAAKGNIGNTGASGSPGAAATITVGTVTTLAPGASATVTNAGTSGAAVFDFGIPQGAAGAGSGTVTSVGISMPSQFTVSSSPVTASGTLTIVWGTGSIPLGNGGTGQTAWAKGDILYASATNTLSKLAKGSDGNVLTLAAGLPTWAAPAVVGVRSPDIWVRDEKASGTAGGTASAGVSTRTLNTIKNNTISATLSSNQLTLSAGTYFLEWASPVSNVDQNQTEIYDATNSVILAVGQNAYASGTGSGAVSARGCAIITLTASTAITLRHRVTTTQSANGFGRSTGYTTEVYAELWGWKVA